MAMILKEVSVLQFCYFDRSFFIMATEVLSDSSLGTTSPSKDSPVRLLTTQKNLFLMVFSTKDSAKFDPAFMEQFAQHTALHQGFARYTDPSGKPDIAAIDRDIGPCKSWGAVLMNPGECEVKYDDQRKAYDLAASKSDDETKGYNKGQTLLEDQYLTPKQPRNPDITRAKANVRALHSAQFARGKQSLQNQRKTYDASLAKDRVWTTDAKDTNKKTKEDYLQALGKSVSLYTVCTLCFLKSIPCTFGVCRDPCTFSVNKSKAKGFKFASKLYIFAEPFGVDIGDGGNPQNFIRKVKSRYIASIFRELDSRVTECQLMFDVSDVGVCKLDIMAALYIYVGLKKWEVRIKTCKLLREPITGVRLSILTVCRCFPL